MDLVIPFLQSSMICVSILKTIQFLNKNNFISNEISRKFIHTSIGTVYSIAWLLFPINNYYSRYVMGLIPLIFAFQFTLIGIGFIDDPKTVNSMSRSGNPSELLKGPVAYGYIMSILTMYYWFDSPIGLITILILSIGDGFSAIMGILYGRRKLPHNKNKTYMGTTGFFVFSFVCTYFILNLMKDGFQDFQINSIIPSLFVTCLICAFVESLPLLPDWDNITVTITSVVILKLLGW